MSFILGFFIRFKFLLTSRAAATRMIESELEKTLAIGERLGDLRGESGCVPLMPGVDEDMREWNFYQILEHNTIVNRQVLRAVFYLCEAGPPPDPGFDVKRDVMPTGPGSEKQVTAFKDSVTEVLERSKVLETLRGTPIRKHPLFGPFDAHKWYCMIGFHLFLHRRQAEVLEKQVKP